eukprot:6828073-Ditylum_brightwellii.AAC.2
MKAKIDMLMKLDCFAFKSEKYHPGDGWQKTALHMVFDAKHDLRMKARLVAGGHLVHVMDTPVYSSTVKNVSIQLLHVISHKDKLDQLCGDIRNVFPNVYANEKVFVARAGPEFGEHKGKCIMIRKELHGLCSSSEKWRSHLADTFLSFGFTQTRFDNDV